MPSIEVHPHGEAACRSVVDNIEAVIRSGAGDGREQGWPIVLGLPTGRTMIPVYAELVRRHREEGLSFAHVTTFNLDEHWPVAPDSPFSFRREMEERLFAHVDIDRRRIHLPDGTVGKDGVAGEAARYEAAIRAAGGLDLVVLGLGPNGHVAYDEPGSPRDSRTRLVELASGSVAALAATGEPDPPRQAITVGIATILDARRAIVLATGAAKADIVGRALLGPVGPDVPASFLQEHPAASFVLDKLAAEKLPATG